MTMLKKIELLMENKGINKAELSRGADIPYTTIDGIWKRGTDNLKRTTLIKLAKYFKCSIDYIADDDILINISSPIFSSLNAHHNMESQLISNKEFNHVKKYRALDERGKQAVDTILSSQYEVIQSKKETTALPEERKLSLVAEEPTQYDVDERAFREKMHRRLDDELDAAQKGQTSLASKPINGLDLGKMA